MSREHKDVRDQFARSRLGQLKAARRANTRDGVSQRQAFAALFPTGLEIPSIHGEDSEVQVDTADSS